MLLFGTFVSALTGNLRAAPISPSVRPTFSCTFKFVSVFNPFKLTNNPWWNNMVQWQSYNAKAQDQLGWRQCLYSAADDFGGRRRRKRLFATPMVVCRNCRHCRHCRVTESEMWGQQTIIKSPLNVCVVTPFTWVVSSFAARPTIGWHAQNLPFRWNGF